MTIQQIKDRIAGFLDGEALNQWNQLHRETVNEYVIRVQRAGNEFDEGDERESAEDNECSAIAQEYTEEYPG